MRKKYSEIACSTLKQYWGYSEFRPLQQDIVESVLNNEDVLALMPTGGGKSICFQVPALIKDGICIVISPLIALIKDQVYQLKNRNIAAEALYTGIPKDQISKILDDAVDGKIKFLYVSPERLQVASFMERVRYMKISLLTIDEAHCISQWGYDFRPAYTKIAKFREYAPNANVIALTATATPEVKADIINKLSLKNPKTFQKSFSRENLAYKVLKTENKFGKTLALLEKYPGTAIIYVNTRNKTVETAKILNSYGISAQAYNAGLDANIRDERQDSWIKGDTRVVVATNAFGMGIDKPDVRMVIHLDLPQSLEAYYQEAGRAGRDEKESIAFLLYEDADEMDLLEKTENRSIEPMVVRDIYEKLCNNYSIAVEATATNFIFNLSDFSLKNGYKEYQLSKALGILEEEGLISFSDNFDSRSTLIFRVNVAGLHKFFKESPKLAPVLQNILRVYGGEIFNSPLKISESLLAKNLKQSVEEIKKQLNYLNKVDIIRYEPSQSVTHISFFTPRIEKNRLPINSQLIENLNKTYLQKSTSMINYCKQTLVCRVQYILDYFVEKTFTKCGKCDICLNGKLQEISDDLYLECRTRLEPFLKTPKTLKDLIKFLNFDDERTTFTLLDKMTKYGDIKQINFDEFVLGD